MHPAAWHPDPTSRHQFRYWDGSMWTEHVADDGVTASDPLAAGTTSSEYDSQDNSHLPGAREQGSSLESDIAALKRDVARLTQLLTANNMPANTSYVPTQPQLLGSTDGRNSVATASAVIGSIAVVMAFIPVFGVLGVIAGIGAIMLGSVGRKRAQQIAVGSAASLAGIITGALATVIGITITVVQVITLNSSTFIADFREFDACVEETGDIDGCAEPFENGELFRYLR